MKNSECNISIVVTGVGAIIGQGIIRSLRLSSYNVRIIGIDRNPLTAGTYLCDAFEVKPSVDEGDSLYLDFWKNLISKYDIALILPGLEQDMYFLNTQRSWFDELGTAVALNSAALIDQTADKWIFGQILTSIGYTTIPSVCTNDWQEMNNTLGPPPFLLKPRHGNGSRGIIKIEDPDDIGYWNKKMVAPWMLQRIVGNDEQEFTVGVFGLGNGQYLGPIIFRRRLSAMGNTVEAEVSRNTLISTAVLQLCTHFKPIGPTNLQFRIEGDIAYLLEINPRFSSSNSLRSAFGFNEAEMAIDYYVHGREPTSPNIIDGVAWRYTEDWIIHAGHTF